MQALSIHNIRRMNHFTMRSYISHILPIILSIILPGLGLYTSTRWVFLNNTGLLGTWLVFSCVLYALWYLLWLLWDQESRTKHKWIIIALAIVTLSLLGGINVYVDEDNAKWYAVVRITLPTILFLSIQYSLKSQENISRLLLEKEQIQTENYKAQLKALRSQIDPHFLFNSLNTLRSMVRQRHNCTEQFIMSLSDFYRQTLKHNENATLPLKEELSVLESYLFVMKNRNEQAISVEVSIDTAIYDLHIPSLALQIVVENCFKHNMMTSRMPLYIVIKNKANQHIEISNNIQPKIEEGESTGFGLKLLRRRYELMSIPDGVLVEKTHNTFSVSLKLIEP